MPFQLYPGSRVGKLFLAFTVLGALSAAAGEPVTLLYETRAIGELTECG